LPFAVVLAISIVVTAASDTDSPPVSFLLGMNRLPGNGQSLQLLAAANQPP
jgi:hypothetical protein